MERLTNAEKACLLSFIQKESKRPILWVTSTLRKDQQLTDLSFFQDQFFDFPAWETLPEETVKLFLSARMLLL
jgi:transcription-repair coupling factor (superfamily II helicase)